MSVRTSVRNRILRFRRSATPIAIGPWMSSESPAIARLCQIASVKLWSPNART